MLRGAVAAGGMSAIALSATWSDISVTLPTTQSASNGERTLTFSGGARNISASITGDDISGALQYRINSGSWVTYTVPFSVTSGQTVGWRTNGIAGPASSTITVNDASRGVYLDDFTVTVS